ncbi:MAG: DUF998 domain-containing protein [Acidimicrobiia bacterium]
MAARDMASRRRRSSGVLACLGLSALFLGLAASIMPESYSWVADTTSESAAQGLRGAWLARLGFLTFGLGVMWLASLAGALWGRWGTTFHRSFGVLLLATATFSHRPIDTDVPYDATEDLLHSISATAMGFAFALGVVAVMMRSERRPLRRRVLSVVAIVASVVVPLAMSAFPDQAGLLQRAMFLIAYLWYGFEALGMLELSPRPQTLGQPR